MPASGLISLELGGRNEYSYLYMEKPQNLKPFSWGWGYGSVVEHLSSKCEVLSLILGTTKK